MNRGFVQALFPGPIDVVGDIHGEIDALRDLLRVLGYDAFGEHPAGRRLVFVGDLCDRGPDSIAVARLVGELAARGAAQCVLGNHELNVLREARKEGNGWLFDRDHDAEQGTFGASRRATAAERDEIREFYARLPLALERDDLRVVHAAWSDAAIDALATDHRSIMTSYDAYADRLEADANESGLAARADVEEALHFDAISNPDASVPLLENSGRQDELYQMGNPLRVLTSGPERLGKESFFATGKWRMVDRVQWWNDYADSPPVIFGHYWRWPNTGDYGVFGT
jgi:hypothetical protein